jgi:hypothetical protein
VFSYVRSRAIVLPLGSLALAGCANLWGFQVVTAEPVEDAAADTTELDAGDAEAASAPTEDATRVGEGQGPSGTLGTPAEAGGGDTSGHDAGEPDAGSSESSASEPCGTNCVGCCDARGQCQGGRAITFCGGAGLACVDCSTTTCAILYGACCGGASGCGCQLLSLGLVQCQ